MIFNYNGVKVYYDYRHKNNSRPIVLLHGWARDGSDFDGLSSMFKDRSILTVDFPPFGQSQKDVLGWNIYTYVGMLMSLCDHLNIENADFVGHSFGGRIVIILSAVKRSLVHSCILIDSAGMRPRRSVKFRLRQLKLSIARKLHLNYHPKGSADYEALSPEMKKTFKSIVNTHLEDYARKMPMRTLIIWGEKDNETPLYMARRLNRLIKNSQLKILKNGSHFSFLECKFEFFSCVEKFFMEE